MDCDSVIVLKLSGTLVGTEEDCLYLSTYGLPSGSRFYDLADSATLQKLKDVFVIF